MAAKKRKSTGDRKARRGPSGAYQSTGGQGVGPAAATPAAATPAGGGPVAVPAFGVGLPADAGSGRRATPVANPPLRGGARFNGVGRGKATPTIRNYAFRRS
ncbi:hypothetical protein [Micromonospora sp. HM5-17]|uniref:hypothetical protein n=1 Tax=Micromonospora sp. HM5-17 TaxID=2487710 RepID=UPI000F476C7D|nr:hypothetical protein [Micromonospora sp. HM5-17]ROT27097.1 hypothetical protein EF879_24160 [Micromonospora sp. HM5-17]